MCAALTVPIIKDGYRLYPGMPVGGRHHPNGRHHGVNRPGAVGHHQRPPTSKGSSRNNMTIVGGSRGSSPPDSVSAYSGSPPNANNGQHQNVRQVILQPRLRTSSNQSQMSARSSFDVAPTSSIRPDLYRGRSAMSTSQLYMQQRRELAIQQQLRKQELARLQQQQQQQGAVGSKMGNRKSSSNVQIPPHPQTTQRSDSNGNDSIVTDYDAEDSLNYCYDHQQSSKTCAGDHNNNKDSNPLRKLLKRLGLGNNTNNQQQHQTNQRSESTSLNEEPSIEQAVNVLQCSFVKTPTNAGEISQVAVTARQ